MIRSTAGVLLASILLSACTVTNPPLTGETKAPPPAVAPKLGPKTFEKTFGFSKSEATQEQNKFDENTVSVFFQANKDGNSVNDLKVQDLVVTENNVAVSPFTLSADVERSNQVADIVFLVDVTGTMVELIETAKVRLKEFINSSRKAGYHTRMCFSTFGDYTVKKCTRFFDNNPKDPSTEAQVRELLSELTKIHAYRGEGQDPGYPDLDENPMQALVDAAKAPWGADSQRFVILVTDWGFLYSPENIGEQAKKGKLPNPPTIPQVHQAIKDSQMKIFAVTRTQHTHRGQNLVWDGYNTPFQGQPGIVQVSGGEHFDFDKVLAKQITLDQIFERILKRINTTYKLTYVVDKVPGLDPTLPVAQRNVDIRLTDPAKGTTKKASTLSSMPTGRPNYQQTFKISDQNIQQGTMQVFMSDKEVAASEYTVTKGEVRFKAVPPAGSKLRFVFLYEAIDQNLRLEAISLRGALTAQNTKVYLNDIEMPVSDDMFARDIDGNSSVTLPGSVKASNDPYGIRKNQGLKVKVVTTF